MFVDASTRQASMKPSMSDTGSSSASALSRIKMLFSLAADRPEVRSHRKTGIGYANGIVTNNELTTVLSESSPICALFGTLLASF